MAGFAQYEPEQNAHFIEDGDGRGSWDEAASKWDAVKQRLADEHGRSQGMVMAAATSGNSEAADAIISKLKEIQGVISKFEQAASDRHGAAKSVAEAFTAAEGAIVPSEEVAAVRRELAYAAAAETCGGFMGVFHTLSRKVLGKKSMAELEAELQRMRVQNGRTLDSYVNAIKSSAEGLDGLDSESMQKNNGSLNPSGSGDGTGYAPGGGTGYAAAGGGGGGSYGAGGPRVPGYDPINADEIDIESMLDRYTGEGGAPGSQGFGTGRQVDYGSGYEPLGYTPRDFSSDYSYDSSDAGSDLSSYTPGSYTPGSFTGSNFTGSGIGSLGGYDSSAGARTNLSGYSSPHVGVPGGMSNMGRYVGAGSMNPMGFRGAGVAGTPGAMTGGLGMMGTTANPASGFGGVQTTSAAATPARPAGGMMPMGAGMGGARGGKKSGSSEGMDVRSSDNDVYNGINAIETREASAPAPSADPSAGASKREDTSFHPLR